MMPFSCKTFNNIPFLVPMKINSSPSSCTNTDDVNSLNWLLTSSITNGNRGSDEGTLSPLTASMKYVSTTTTKSHS